MRATRSPVLRDVSNESDVRRLVDEAIAAFGDVQVLVNNAGVYGPMGSIEDVDWASWVRAIEINLYGSVLPIRAVLPHFKQRGYGKIIQLSGGGATALDQGNAPAGAQGAYAARQDCRQPVL